MGVFPVPQIPMHGGRAEDIGFPLYPQFPGIGAEEMGVFALPFRPASAGRSLLLLRHVHGFLPLVKRPAAQDGPSRPLVLGGHPGLWSWIWLGVEVPALSALVGPVSGPALGSISGV